MGKLVSVIITVYNESKYIGKCIESVLMQTYGQLEIIIIDDGSIDNSLVICRGYEAKDKRIKVISKENEGKVKALKVGVSYSSGDYIVSVDGDDWLDDEMVETLIDKAIKYDSDFVQCEVRYTDEHGNVWYYDEPLSEGCYELSKDDCLVYKYLFWGSEDGLGRMRSNVWSCLINKEIFYNTQMEIPEIICNGEDDAGYYSMLMQAKRYYCLRKPLYNHLIRNGSMGRSANQYSLEQIVAIDELLFPKVKAHKLRRKLLWRYKKYFEFLMRKFLSMTHSIYVERHYDFIFDDGLSGKNVVVYGAGKVGKSIILQNEKKQWFNIVLWVDRKGAGYWEDFKIDTIESIKEVSFDVILLALLNENVVAGVKKHLLSMGIKESVIVWNKPVTSDFSFYVDTDRD